MKDKDYCIDHIALTYKNYIDNVLIRERHSEYINFDNVLSIVDEDLISSQLTKLLGEKYTKSIFINKEIRRSLFSTPMHHIVSWVLYACEDKHSKINHIDGMSNNTIFEFIIFYNVLSIHILRITRRNKLILHSVRYKK